MSSFSSFYAVFYYPAFFFSFFSSGSPISEGVYVEAYIANATREARVVVKKGKKNIGS